MNDNFIFSKTAKGVAALGEKGGALSREHYRLLGLVDGRSNLAELAERSGLSREIAEQALSRLLASELVKRIAVVPDAVMDQLPDEKKISVTELDPEEGVRAWAEAQRIARGLKEAGFYAHASGHALVKKGRPSILSIEDDPMMARLLVTLLEGDGFEARHAPDGKGMIDALRDSVPELLLLDVVLPDTTGFKLLEWVRNQPQLADLPTIMLTSKVSEEDVMHGLRAGADGYLFKPFKPESLLQCIRSVLKM